MDTQPGATLQLDRDGQRIVRLAAEIGALTTDTVYVNFSRLLLALVFARTAISTALRQQIDSGRLRLDLEKLLSSQGVETLSASVLHDLSVRTESVVLEDWPSERPLLSNSATHMLDVAAKIAADRLRPGAAAGAADIVTAYLFHVPPEQGLQIEDWKFRPRSGGMPALLRRLAEAADPMPLEWRTELSAAHPEAMPPIEGYDIGASTILRLAWFIAGSRPGAPKGLVNSAALFIATAEAAPLLSEEDRIEVTLIRDAVTRTSAATAYARKRDQAYALPSDLAAAVSTTGTDWPDLTQDAQAIIETARMFAAWTTGDFTVSPRHLILALLVERDGADRATTLPWLQLGGALIEEFRTALDGSVQENHPTDSLDVWARLLVAGDNRRVVTTLEPDTIPRDPRPFDKLGLRRYADAMAALIAARNQKPPLSIAVFGPWGSGKSFFMAMVRAAVREFAQAQTSQSDAASSGRFLRRIVQIEFNAWHYVEGNLWASLVYAILETLQIELSPQADQTAFQDLLRQLSLSKAAEEQAQTRLQEAEQRQAEAQAALHQAERVAVECRAAQREIATADVLSAFRVEALDRLRPDAEHGDVVGWIHSIGEAVVKSASYLGRPELADTVPALRDAASDASIIGTALSTRIGDVETVLEEARAGSRQGTMVLTWLANARFEPLTCLKLVLIAAGLFTAALIIAFILERHGAAIAAAATATASLLLPLVATLTVFVRWARGHLADASKAFAILEGLRARLERARARRLSEHELGLQAALRAASEAEAEAARRRAEFDAAIAAHRKAEEDIKAATSVEQMKQFVAQRLAAGDYLRHLGLIHTIRADMRRLEAFLAEVHARTAQTEPPVERIVLFIDDLDRCPPRRVVEVLEAVHLLLAFPLFVVVVGVDVRWVSQALRQRYPHQLSASPDTASPVDYLEKVFQIPFWLPPMDAEAGRRLLAAVLPAAEPREVNPGREYNEHHQPSSIPATTVDVQTGELPPVAQGWRPQPSLGARHELTALSPSTIAEALTLSQRERERLLDMAEAVGASPRRAKRFANLYLLFKASLLPSERHDMERRGGLGRSYISAMILLSGLTGAPKATGRLLRALMEGPAQDEDAGVRLKEMLATARPDQQERVAFAVVEGALVGIDDEPAALAHLRTWAPRVGRFLFDVPGQ